MRVSIHARLPFLTPTAAAICALALADAAQAQDTTPKAAEPAASSASSPAATSGDSDPAYKLQRVEVTARRRLETQFDVPASVTAISGTDLRNSGITSIQDIMSLVPNATMGANPNGTDTYISLRGVTQGDVTAEPNFGAYRNGMFVGGHRVNLGVQVDVDRVEVVRGPQGGLYGRDAVGGSVDVVYAMPKPGDALNGYVTLGAGNVGTTRIEGAVTTPINDTLATRATFWSNNQTKGDLYNSYLGDWVDRQSDRGMRFSAAENLSPSLSLEGTVEYQAVSGPALSTYAPDGVLNGVVTSPTETKLTIQRDTDSREDHQQTYLSGKLRYNIPAGTMTLQASLRDYTLHMNLDQDHTALQPTAGPLVLQEVGNWNEKLRQTYVEALWESDPGEAFNWRAGLSFFSEDFGTNKIFTTSLDTDLLPLVGIDVPALGTITGSAGLPYPGSAINTRSSSAFVDLRYEESKELAFTATVRYTRDKESLVWSQGIFPGSNPIAVALFTSSVPTFSLDEKNTYGAVSPSAGVEYKLDRSANVYALYSTAFRPGGYNTSVTNPADISYGQEKVQNYEAGIKTLWLDGRAGVNLSVFRMNQRDLAIQQEYETTILTSSYLANVGSARTQGVEVEADARLVPALGLSLSAGYLDSKFTEATVNAGTPQAVDLRGRSLSGVRPWTINAQATYRVPLSQTAQLSATGGVRREVGGYYGDQSQYALSPLTTLNLSAGLNLSKKTQISVYVHNAENKTITLYRFAAGDVANSTGRRYGLQLSHQL